MSDWPTIITAPVRNQKLDLTDAQRQAIAAFNRRMEGRMVRVSFGLPTRGRSDNQNRYYWGICLSLIADETGHTTEEIHEVMKRKFLPRKFVSFAGVTEEVPKSTTTLTTKEMEEYLSTSGPSPPPSFTSASRFPTRLPPTDHAEALPHPRER